MSEKGRHIDTALTNLLAGARQECSELEGVLVKENVSQANFRSAFA